MISISPAHGVEDFMLAESLARRLADWDAIASEPYGISEEDVRTIFHSDSSAAELMASFDAADSAMLLARSGERPVGCLAFSPFDGQSLEMHRVFVDTDFRGQGIGRLLMQKALTLMPAERYRKILIHTAVQMGNAVALYTSLGFKPCPRFRETPEHIRHTDIFMSKSLPI